MLAHRCGREVQQLEHETVAPQVTRGHAERRWQPQQLRRQVIGRLDLPFHREAEQLDVEALRPFEFHHALAHVVEGDGVGHDVDPRTDAAGRDNEAVRITFLGHVGMFVETRGGSVLCDPWFTPAYFGSWFPFPRNDRLERAAFSRPDYLYLSHLHRDHFDPAFLAGVDKHAPVLLPDFEVTYLEDELRELGFTDFVKTSNGTPV